MTYDPTLETIPISQIAMAFESLGGSGHGCEFGLFQREVGAEPLGLLRWADLSFELLTAAIEQNFDGVGEPEHTIVFLPTENSSHYWTRDSRYWMAQGFHVPASKITQEEAKRQVCRRQQFLRKKIISDLHEGSKIFVYKNNFRNLETREINRLFSAIRKYGPGSLLYVRVIDDGHGDGTIEHLQDGLMVGYVRHFSHSSTEEHLGSPIDSWVEICRQAYTHTEISKSKIIV